MSETDIRRILEAIARLEEKVVAIGADNVRGEQVHKDHETRIRALERVRWLIGGAFFAIGTPVGAFAYRVLSGS